MKPITISPNRKENTIFLVGEVPESTNRCNELMLFTASFGIPEVGTMKTKFEVTESTIECHITVSDDGEFARILKEMTLRSEVKYVIDDVIDDD